MTDISVLIYTARDDFPYPGRPEMHCFEPVVETLKTQGFRYFELVIVDAAWEQRSDYFLGRSLPFSVKHVPASPNPWHARGRPAVCSQINRGLAWCDGALVWIGAENNLFPPHFLQKAWEVFRTGKIPVAWYAILEGESQINFRFPAITFNMLGWTEKDIRDVDHRAERFVDTDIIISPCHHKNYFAYAGLPLEVAYALNGFDENLDGDFSALDVDMGSRIEMLLGDSAIAMHRDLWLMEPPSAVTWASGISKWGKPIKCGYALWWYNRLIRRTRANESLSDGWIDDVKQRVCGEFCEIRVGCKAGDPTIGERIMHPFCESQDQSLVQFWKDNTIPHNLADDAAARKLGLPPFDRGTFT